MNNRLKSYLKKYSEDLESDEYRRFVDEYNCVNDNGDFSVVEKPLRYLLKWQKENIAYHRLQSIWTTYDWCIKYANNPEQLKKEIDSYFRFDDQINIFDILVENPNEYSLWLAPLLTSNGSLDSLEELHSKRAALRRFTETYRNNVALNFISGMLALVTNEEDFDSKQRLQTAFERIATFDSKEKRSILAMLAKIKNHLSYEAKCELSEVILTAMPDYGNEVYLSLEDDYSCNKLLSDFTLRIKNAKGKLV